MALDKGALKQRQFASLSAKIDLAKRRLREFYNKFDEFQWDYIDDKHNFVVWDLLERTHLLDCLTTNKDAPIIYTATAQDGEEWEELYLRHGCIKKTTPAHCMPLGCWTLNDIDRYVENYKEV